MDKGRTSGSGSKSFCYMDHGVRRHITIYKARTPFFKPTIQEVTIVRKRKVVRFEVRVEARMKGSRYATTYDTGTTYPDTNT